MSGASRQNVYCSDGLLGRRGSTLVEALAALVVVGLAAAIVAAAAGASVRAVHRAALVVRVSVLAARELSALQSRGAPLGTDEAVLPAPGLPGGVWRRADVRRDGDVRALTVTASGGQPAQRATLATRMLEVP